MTLRSWWSGIAWSALLLVGATAAGSCGSATACAPEAIVAIAGAWSYSAIQSSPSTATLAGTLDITSQCGRNFSGTLDVTEIDAQGRSRRLTGPVSGRALDTTSVDFDAFLDITARRHLGALRGDSIRGTWVEQLESGTSSGSFQSARLPLR